MARRKIEIIHAIRVLRYKSRNGLIPSYEASLCIGALNWVLKDKNVNTDWFEYRLKESEVKNET